MTHPCTLVDIVWVFVSINICIISHGWIIVCVIAVISLVGAVLLVVVGVSGIVVIVVFIVVLNSPFCSHNTPPTFSPSPQLTTSHTLPTYSHTSSTSP